MHVLDVLSVQGGDVPHFLPPRLQLVVGQDRLNGFPLSSRSRKGAERPLIVPTFLSVESLPEARLLGRATGVSA